MDKVQKPSLLQGQGRKRNVGNKRGSLILVNACTATHIQYVPTLSEVGEVNELIHYKEISGGGTNMRVTDTSMHAD
jgi:hypothetical protein